MLKSELRSFHAVAKSSGFSAAAKDLNISQPTLSSQVKMLEQRYDVTLFKRSGRGVTLTPAGQDLYDITTRLHQAEADAEGLLESFRGFHSGTINIAAVGPFHATDMIIAFKAQFPNVNVEVSFGNSQHCFDRLLVFQSYIRIIAEVPSDSKVVTQQYSTHQVVVFANSQHPFFHRDGIKLKELAGQKVVRREPGSTTRIAVENELSAKGVTIDPVLELGSREGIWKAVEQGLGIGFVADFEFVPHPNLRTIPIVDAHIETRYFLAYLKDREHTPMVRSFMDVALNTPTPMIKGAAPTT